MSTPHFHPLRSPICAARRKRRVDCLRGPAGACQRLRLRARPIPHACARRLAARMRGAPTRSARASTTASFGSPSRGRRRPLLDPCQPRAEDGRRHRGDDADGPLHDPPRSARRACLCRHGLRLRHHAGMSHIKRSSSRETKSHFVLIYGNRSSRDIIFKDALEDLKDVISVGSPCITCSPREAQDSPLLHGRLDAERSTPSSG